MSELSARLTKPIRSRSFKIPRKTLEQFGRHFDDLCDCDFYEDIVDTECTKARLVVWELLEKAKQS